MFSMREDLTGSLVSASKARTEEVANGVLDICICPENIYRNVVTSVRSLVQGSGVAIPLLVTFLGVKMIIKGLRETKEMTAKLRHLEEEVVWLKKENLYTFKEIRTMKKRFHEMGDTESLDDYWWKKEYLEELEARYPDASGAGEGGLQQRGCSKRPSTSPRCPKEKHIYCLKEPVLKRETSPCSGVDKRRQKDKSTQRYRGEGEWRQHQSPAEDKPVCSSTPIKGKKGAMDKCGDSPPSRRSKGGPGVSVDRAKDLLCCAQKEEEEEAHYKPNSCGDTPKRPQTKIYTRETQTASQRYEMPALRPRGRPTIRSKTTSPGRRSQLLGPCRRVDLCYCPKEEEVLLPVSQKSNLYTASPSAPRRPPAIAPRVNLCRSKASEGHKHSPSIPSGDSSANEADAPAPLKRSLSRTFARTSLVLSDRNLISSISWLNTGDSSRVSTLFI